MWERLAEADISHPRHGIEPTNLADDLFSSPFFCTLCHFQITALRRWTAAVGPGAPPHPALQQLRVRDAHLGPEHRRAETQPGRAFEKVSSSWICKTRGVVEVCWICDVENVEIVGWVFVWVCRELQQFGAKVVRLNSDHAYANILFANPSFVSGFRRCR